MVAAAGLGMGITAALAADLAVVAAIVAAAALALAERSTAASAWLATTGWRSPSTRSSSGLTMRFGFYPFYAAFLVAILVALVRGRLNVDPTVAWLYIGFMVTAAWSFLQFTDPVSSEAIQRLMAPEVDPRFRTGSRVGERVRFRDGELVKKWRRDSALAFKANVALGGRAG